MEVFFYNIRKHVQFLNLMSLYHDNTGKISDQNNKLGVLYL